MTKPETPTTQAYDELQIAFDHFNQHLFDNQLPECLITLQRQKQTLGYFAKERFAQTHSGKMTDEIAMHPGYFATRPVIETTFATIKEAMCTRQTVAVSGFGHFSTKKHAARIGRNPSTGAAMDIPEAIVPKFKAAAALKAAVNA